MRSPVPYIRTILQFPLAIAMIAVKSVVEFFDFILDHTNTPIAKLVDIVCLDLLPEIGQHASILMGAALHATLYKMYLFSVGLSIPALEGLLMLGAEHLSPVFASIATAVIPPLAFAVPYIFMGIGGLVVLNQLVCLKKILTAASTTPDPEKDSQSTDRLERMRSSPVESGLRILHRLLKPIITFPDFLNEAYDMASDMKSKIGAVLWPWGRTKEPLIINPSDLSNAVTAGLGSAFPLDELDPQLTEQVANTDTKQPLMFSKEAKGEAVEENDAESQFKPNMIERSQSCPSIRSLNLIY